MDAGGKVFNQVEAVEVAERLPDLLLGRVRTGRLHVLCDGARKEEVLLEDEAHLTA